MRGNMCGVVLYFTYVLHFCCIMLVHVIELYLCYLFRIEVDSNVAFLIFTVINMELIYLRNYFFLYKYSSTEAHLAVPWLYLGIVLRKILFTKIDIFNSLFLYYTNISLIEFIIYNCFFINNKLYFYEIQKIGWKYLNFLFECTISCNLL